MQPQGPARPKGSRRIKAWSKPKVRRGARTLTHHIVADQWQLKPGERVQVGDRRVHSPGGHHLDPSHSHCYPRLRRCLGKSPTGTVLPLDELRGFRTILCFHFVRVPFDFLAGTESHTAEQHDLSEGRGNVETRVAPLWLVFLDGNEPLLRMGKNAAATAFFGVVRIARNALWIFRQLGMLEIVDEFLIALQFDEEAGAIIVRREDGAAFTDQQATAIGHFSEESGDISGQLRGRLIRVVVTTARVRIRLASVVPPEGERIVLDFPGAMPPVRMLERNVAVALWEGIADF